ncbi:hypothetical protein [Sulfurospirillum barnesii]|uniref:Uncharacterized protein n=1 Tax=Sulfurospirillum barnesii (strain ATCC 700032 / DSM 10660 / SES-3) TaxID=760154 RepID=I3XWK3_SULBS|nr:hypothetical protein [Sulfurospirillum barnesii]AFL68327.1 hypothetical protein Sulba_1028 [Sulfurospirillum barnesii SES-3]
MRILKWFCVVFLVLHVNAKSSFELTPEMYASFMAQSLKGSLPQSFTYENIELIVHKVTYESNKVHFEASTPHYAQLLAALKKQRTLPEKIQMQCTDFSKLSMVDKGVEYVLHVNANAQKPIEVLYDKEVCAKAFDVQKRIFIGGVNRYGERMNEKRKNEALTKR